MKTFKKLCLLFTAVMLFACSGGTIFTSPAEKAIKAKFNAEQTYYVVAIEVGDNVMVSKEASGDHQTTLPNAGARIDDNVLLTNHVIRNYVIGCLGCDECMNAYAKAGLISYKVKSDMGDCNLASISLTNKGDKYRIESFIPEFNLPDSEDVEFLVLSYGEVDNIEVLSEYQDGKYLCRGDINVVTTPVLDALGYDKSSTKPEELTRTQLWNVCHLEDPTLYGAVEEISDVEYIFDGGNKFAYDLNEYTKEAALKEMLGLLDNHAAITCRHFNWDGLYLGSRLGKIKRGEELPAVAQSALLENDGSNYYFLEGTRAFGEIIRDGKMSKIEGAEGCFAWNLSEIEYTVNVDYNEFGAAFHECPQKATFYGKIPYIVIENVMYFIPDALPGIWANSKPAMKSYVYGTSIADYEDVGRPHYSDGFIPVEYLQDRLN